MNEHAITVIESFALTGHDVHVEIEHDGRGLSKGTILRSNTGKRWTVNGRAIFNHVAEKQKRFPNETNIQIRLSFKEIEHRMKSAEDILARERLGIFEYLLTPLGHIEKPQKGEELFVELSVE